MKPASQFTPEYMTNQSELSLRKYFFFIVWECHACIQCVLHILAMFTAYFLLSIFSSISSRLFYPDCICVWVQGHLLGHGLCSRGFILEENKLSSQLPYLTIASQCDVGFFFFNPSPLSMLGFLSGLILCTVLELLWIYMCSFPVVSGKCHFSVVICCLCLLHCSCPLSVSLRTGRVYMRVSMPLCVWHRHPLRAKHSTVSYSLLIAQLRVCGLWCLLKETWPMRAKKCTILWSEQQ